MATYNVRVYEDGAPIASNEVQASSPRIAINKALASRFGFVTKAGRDLELKQDKKLTITIIRK